MDHTFDWGGFYFALKLCVLVLVIGSSIPFILPEPVTPIVVTPLRDAEKTMPLPTQSRVEFSTSTPERIIRSLTISDAVPSDGKFIAADLVAMKLYLYQNGTSTAEYPIVMKGRLGTPWETPAGFYAIQTKEVSHFSSIGEVYMPYSMQFYGNYFIHGRTYYPDGTPTSTTFSGGCITLSTEDAKQVFAFADKGTRVFVYDSKKAVSNQAIELYPVALPPVQAQAYLVADMDTGDVYAEYNTQQQFPMASTTQYMTALVANETISLTKKVVVPEHIVLGIPDISLDSLKSFFVGDLYYPLLMQSNSAVAQRMASYYGTNAFVSWMNTTASALAMASTTFADVSGDSTSTVTTADDVFRLITYLTEKKSFVLTIANTSVKTIVADDGSKYLIANAHMQERNRTFTISTSTQANITRRVMVVVLGSPDQEKDISSLSSWIESAIQSGTTQAACATCAHVSRHRRIEF